MQVFSRFLFPIQRNGHWNSVPKAFPLSSCTHLEHICPNVADRGSSQANRCCESKREQRRGKKPGTKFSADLFSLLVTACLHCLSEGMLDSMLGRCRSLRRRLRLRRRCGRCRTRCLCFCRCWRLRLWRGCCFCWRLRLCRLRLRRFCRTARRTLLRTRQIVADHRSSCRNIVKDRLCNTRRQVDTAIRNRRLIVVPPKLLLHFASCIPIPLLNGIQ